MKFIHLSDLHIGKHVNGFSMIEEQRHILGEILDTIEEINPAGVFIAGDVYDRTLPSVEAVKLFDDFLNKLAERNLQVFIIPGNHDSSERLAFGSHIMAGSGVHIAEPYNGRITPTTLEDAGCKVNIYMLPFIRPANVRNALDIEDIKDYTDAVRAAIEKMDVNSDEINILLSHQFVTGASQSGSEELSVGGLENVDASVFEVFDYVALGHIHGAQNIGENIRYCGTPLKYSFSEANHTKSLTIIDVQDKGNIEQKIRELLPLHDMVEIKGEYDDLMLKSFYDREGLREAYVHVTLTDEEDIPDALAKLRTVYKNIMKLDYDNHRTRSTGSSVEIEAVDELSPTEVFDSLYESLFGGPMSNEQHSYIDRIINKVWEEDL